MHTATKIFLTTISLVAGMACTKEVEKIVVQDKVYSWAEVKQLSGSQKIIVQMTQDAASLYLQQLGYLGRLNPLPGAVGSNSTRYYSTTLLMFAPLPYDLKNRLPMNATFYLNPTQDGNMVLRAYPITYVAPSNMPAEIDLRRLDSSATGFINHQASPYFAFGAITRNNYSLVGYTVAPADRALHLVLSRLSLDSGIPEQGPVTVASRILGVPLPATEFYTIAAIDDYFLVNVFNQGIYKISETGIVRKVLTSPSIAIRSYHKHQGILYAINNTGGGNGILTSADDGETWQLGTGIPDYFVFSTFHSVGDSIVGITHEIRDNVLYTLRWQGNTYRVRQLKDDGLNQADFTDLAQLGDTVYLSTTNGLFKRPLTNFFESR